MYEFNYDGQRNLFKKIMTDRKSLIPGKICIKINYIYWYVNHKKIL